MAVYSAVISTLTSIKCRHGICLCCVKAKVHEEDFLFLVRDDYTLVYSLVANYLKPPNIHKVHKEMCEQ